MKHIYSFPLMRQYKTTQNTQALGSDRPQAPTFPQLNFSSHSLLNPRRT